MNSRNQRQNISFFAFAAQLEEVRTRLARQYADNVSQYEAELKKIQRERQAVFQDAFQHDLELYKQQGMIPSEFYHLICALG